MKRFLCLVLLLVMIVSCAPAETLQNVYKSKNFIIYPLPGYILSTQNGMSVYNKGTATIGVMEIPYEKYDFKSIVDLYDVLLVGFVSGMQDENTTVGLINEIDFGYYSTKIVQVSKKAYTMYVTIIPGPGCVLAISFIDAKSYRPEHDFENFIYCVTPIV